MDHRVSKDMISSGMSYSGNQSKEDLGRTQYGSVARPDVLMNAYQSMYSQDTDQLNEGVRDLDPEKGTQERKARLEKKRGMNLDDHPQYKKEEVKEAKVDKKLPDYKRSAARTERYGNPYGSVGSGPQRDRRADHEARRGIKKEEFDRLDEIKNATTVANDRIPNFETKKVKQVPGLKVNKPPMEEGIDLFDYLLEYLVAEGYADTNKAALAIMANMSEEWKQSIVEAYGDANPSIGGNPVMTGGKPMSMNQAEIKGLERLNKMKRENPKEYKKEQNKMELNLKKY